MTAFEAKELRLFLRFVDSHLTAATPLVLIGGAAASLAYQVTRATVDIDTVSDAAGLRRACRLARLESGLEIPLERVGVFDAPYDYEERLKTLDLGLSFLRIQVPEKHDLALMKVVRGQEHDRAVISEMAATVGISKDILVTRFLEEMGHVVGRREELELNFLAVIEDLFGETEADEVEEQLRTGR